MKIFDSLLSNTASPETFFSRRFDGTPSSSLQDDAGFHELPRNEPLFPAAEGEEFEMRIVFVAQQSDMRIDRSYMKLKKGHEIK